MADSEVKIVMPAGEISMFEEFLLDSKDQLSEVEDLILQVEDGGDEADEAVQKIFRLVHSIKGTAGFFGLISVERLGHRLETLMDQLRQGGREIDPGMTDCLLDGCDHLIRLLEETLAACQHTVTKGNDVVIQYAESDVAETLEWIESEIDKGKSGQARPPKAAAVAPRREEVAALPTDLSCTVPRELKKDILDETATLLGDSESILQQGKSLGQVAGDDLDTLLRSFHTVKGNAGILVSHVEPEAARKPHIMNQVRELAHAAETMIQDKRDAKGVLSNSEISLLFEIHDALHTFMDRFDSGEDFSLPASDLLNACRAVDKKVPATPVIDRQWCGKAASALADFEVGLSLIGIEDKREAGLSFLGNGLQEIRQAAADGGNADLIGAVDDTLNVVQFLSDDWPPEHDFFAAELQKFAVSTREILTSEPPATARIAVPQPAAARFPGTATSSAPQPASAMAAPKTSANIKVPQERLDNIMNLIGELLVSKNALEYLTRIIATEDGRPDIAVKVKDLSNAVGRIGDELQASIMAVRMTPVNQVFNKFPRLIRDLSRKLHKDIDFQTTGGETELDRTVLETISDPLLHLIRNSADHGLEGRDQRLSLGKPAAGSIILRASNEGQSVRIEIEDDGAGIDTEKVRQKALSSNFLDADTLDRMDEQEINNLIFAPGLSTVKQVTEVSGRGVGMDVVMKGISAAGGRVNLVSRKGKGTVLTMFLPLTLAVSRGLEVEVGGEHYYLPLEFIQETVKVRSRELHFHRDDCIVVRRGAILPVFSLGTLLGIAEDEEKKRQPFRSLVILNVRGRRIAYIVDRFLREGEYVLKPLPGAVGGMEWISGSMITPTGRVILVLDPTKL